MGREDWYRNSTWNEEIRAAFFARLARSRSDGSKAQYLRIQALCLQEAGTADLYEVALTLLDEMLAKYPDAIDAAGAMTQRGQCLEGLGRIDEAIAAYRDSMATQRARPYMRDNVVLCFGELVVAAKRRELFDEALTNLQAFAEGATFPEQKYRCARCQALIAERRGELDKAAEFAMTALAAAAAERSPFARHPHLGLVSAPAEEISRLARLAKPHHALGGRAEWPGW